MHGAVKSAMKRNIKILNTLHYELFIGWKHASTSYSPCLRPVSFDELNTLTYRIKTTTSTKSQTIDVNMIILHVFDRTLPRNILESVTLVIVAFEIDL